MKALFLTDNRGLAGLAINNGPGKFDLPTLSLREDCRHCASLELLWEEKLINTTRLKFLFKVTGGPQIGLLDNNRTKSSNEVGITLLRSGYVLMCYYTP